MDGDTDETAHAGPKRSSSHAPRELPPKFLAAVIALEALPGSPLYAGDDRAVVTRALDDLHHYIAAGVDSVIIENGHDVPYVRPPLPGAAIELVAQVAVEVRRRFAGPVGIALLEAANEAALDIAAKTDLDYLRVEGFVYGHVGPAGLIEGCAGQLLRKRKDLNCDGIKVFGDVRKKHVAHAITADLDIVDEVRQAELFLIDGVVVTGKFTGIEPEANDLQRVRGATRLPVVVGSGMTRDNVDRFLPLADGFIVGSTLRRNGEYLELLDPQRLAEFAATFQTVRRSLLTV